MYFHTIASEVALNKFPRFYLDVKFILAMVSGAFLLWLVHGWLPVFSSGVAVNGWLFMSLVIWQPVIEELLFRGVLQGQLLKRPWAQQTWSGISAANIVTSILFVAIHLITTPSIWSLLIFIPSVLFGYFRDVFRSVYPSIFLHSSYNLFVVLGLLIQEFK